MIIDIHAHTSRHPMLNLHVEKADIADLHNQAQRYGISKIYIMATYFPLKKTGLHNRELLERIKGDDLFGCFGSLDLENDFSGGLQELRQLAEAGQIDGIKLYPGYQNVVIADTQFRPLFQLAQEFSLPVACHLGELHHCCPREERQKQKLRCAAARCILEERGHLATPSWLLSVAKLFPQVKFIACHLANPFFTDLRQVMADLSNVYTDISGQYISGGAKDTPQYRCTLVKEIRQFLELEGGKERVMFATDFPIQSYQDTLELVKALELKPAEEELLLARNARRLLPTRR